MTKIDFQKSAAKHKGAAKVGDQAGAGRTMTRTQAPQRVMGLSPPTPMPKGMSGMRQLPLATSLRSNSLPTHQAEGEKGE